MWLYFSHVEFHILCLSLQGIYECPAGTILRAAHLDVETVTMDRVSHLRNKYFMESRAQLFEA